MPLDVHTLEVADGSTPPTRTDRIIAAFFPAQPNVAGSGAGAAVTLTLTGLVLPSTYGIHATPSQIAIVSFGSKTNSGFTVTLTPLTTGTTLAAGTVDIAVFA